MTSARHDWLSSLALAGLALLLGISIWIPTRLVVTGEPLHPLLFLWSASLLAIALGCRNALLLFLWTLFSVWAAWTYAADLLIPREVTSASRICFMLAGAIGVQLAIVEFAAWRGALWLRPRWLRWLLALTAAFLLLRVIAIAVETATVFSVPMIAAAVLGLALLTWLYAIRSARPWDRTAARDVPAAGPDTVMVALSLALSLFAAGSQAWHAYSLATAGRLVLLPLAVEDVRLLAEGGRLRPVPAQSVLPSDGLAMALPPFGRMVLAVDDHGVGRFVRAANGPQPGPGEHFIRYRIIDQHRSRPSMIYGPQWAPLNAAERAQLDEAAYAVYRLNNAGLATWAGLADQAGRFISSDARAYPLAGLWNGRAQAAWR